MFPNTSVTQSLNRFYSNVSLYRNLSIGSHWKNAGKNSWRAVPLSANIQKKDTPQTMIPQGFCQCKSIGRCLNYGKIKPCHKTGQLRKFLLMRLRNNLFLAKFP